MDEYQDKIRELLKKRYEASDLNLARLFVLEKLSDQRMVFTFRRSYSLFLKYNEEFQPTFSLGTGQCPGGYCRDDYTSYIQWVQRIGNNGFNLLYNNVYTDYNTSQNSSKPENECSCSATSGDHWSVLLIHEEFTPNEEGDDDDDESEYTFVYKKQTIRQCNRCGCFFDTTLRNEICILCNNNTRCIICMDKVGGIGYSSYGGTFVYHDDCLDPIVSNRKCQHCKRKIKSQEVVCSRCEEIVINDYNYKPEPVFFYNGSYNANAKEPFFGIEIETEIKTNLRNSIHKKDVAQRLLNADKSKDAKSRFYIKRDASIGFITKSYRGEGAFEIVSHPMSFEYWHGKNLEPFWEGLSKTAKVASSYNTGNCGIHVHISRVSFDNGLHEAAFGWFIENRQYFVSVICERFPNEYTKPELNDYNSIIANGKRYKSPDHHCVVNYTPSTIEIRPFRGNLKKDRILKDIQFVHAVFSWTKGLKIKAHEFTSKLTTNNFEEYINRHPETYKQLIAYINNHVNKLFLTEPIPAKKESPTEGVWNKWLHNPDFSAFIHNHFTKDTIKYLGLEGDKDIAGYTLNIIEAFTAGERPISMSNIVAEKIRRLKLWDTLTQGPWIAPEGQVIENNVQAGTYQTITASSTITATA